MSNLFLSQSTIEKLGYYVYILIDPRDNSVFYVGKGKGNRVNQHLLGALDENSEETDKIRRIREIQNLGLSVGLDIIRHELTEKEAFEVECSHNRNFGSSMPRLARRIGTNRWFELFCFDKLLH